MSQADTYVTKASYLRGNVTLIALSDYKTSFYKRHVNKASEINLLIPPYEHTKLRINNNNFPQII